MSQLLKEVDLRTRMVGHNRLELLLFRLDGPQRYGINVFKVREVVGCPPLVTFPGAHPHVRGVAVVRGQAITVIDLARAIGRAPIPDPARADLIVCEYNRTVQGFLVKAVDRIVNMQWEDVRQPPAAVGADHYLTAVTDFDGELVEVLDVEKVLYEVTGVSFDEDDVVAGEDLGVHVLVADDSSVARNQITRVLKERGAAYTAVNNGRIALETLQRWADESDPRLANLALVISDVEMPEMDGYTLVRHIREDERLKHLFILLHTSLSGVFDSSLLETVAADAFLSKFDTEELVETIWRQIRRFRGLPEEGEGEHGIRHAQAK